MENTNELKKDLDQEMAMMSYEQALEAGLVQTNEDSVSIDMTLLSEAALPSVDDDFETECGSSIEASEGMQKNVLNYFEAKQLLLVSEITQKDNLLEEVKETFIDLVEEWKEKKNFFHRFLVAIKYINKFIGIATEMIDRIDGTKEEFNKKRELLKRS